MSESHSPLTASPRPSATTVHPVPPRPTWANRILSLLGTLIAIGAVAGGLFFLLERGKKKAAVVVAEKQPVAVTIEPIKRQKMQRSVAIVGSLYGRDEITIFPKVDGRILHFHADVGDRVKPGQLLVEQDPTDYRLNVAEVRRSLELELARLGLKEPPTRELNLDLLPALMKAAAQKTNAEFRRERLRRLGNVVTQEERDSIERDSSIAQADYNQARLDASTTLASIRQKQALLETAEQKLKETQIVVPTTSEATEYAVVRRDVSEGEMVYSAAGMSTALMKLVVDSPLKLRATVPERYRGEVQVGQEIEAVVESFPGEKFLGTVSRVNPAVDRISRTFQVEILLPNKDHRLVPGGFAKVTIQTRVDPTARTVPEESLVTFAGVTKVFIIENNQARSIPVKTGASLEVSERGRLRMWIEVTGNFPADAQVVTSGQTQLADGTRVRIREEK